jgi:hypothetical protein
MCRSLHSPLLHTICQMWAITQHACHMQVLQARGHLVIHQGINATVSVTVPPPCPQVVSLRSQVQQLEQEVERLQVGGRASKMGGGREQQGRRCVYPEAVIS